MKYLPPTLTEPEWLQSKSWIPTKLSKIYSGANQKELLSHYYFLFLTHFSLFYSTKGLNIKQEKVFKKVGRYFGNLFHLNFSSGVYLEEI